MEAILLKKMGLNLKDSEARAILTKYRQERKGLDDSAFNQAKFLEDLNIGLQLMKYSRKANEKDLHRPDVLETEARSAKAGSVAAVKGVHVLTVYEKILLYIRKAIIARSVSMRGENVFKNSFRLLSECRSPLLTRSQLKGACQYRLNASLTDSQVETVFDNLDPMQSGTLRTRLLISAMFPSDADDNDKYGMSLNIPIRIRKVPASQNHSWVKNQDAHVTYDHKFSGLTAPTHDGALHVASIHELECKILDKIFERSHLGANMIQSLIKYFSDARDKSDQYGISRDQMRYTLWKTFQLNVANSDIEKLFKKYDKEESGFIPMDRFIDAIVKGHALNEPLLEDPSVATDSKLHRVGESGVQSTMKSKDLQAFLKFIRRKFRDLINNEGRAPHYLLQTSNRMTTAQAMVFLEQKLDTKIDEKFLRELAVLYDSRGLFDMKLLLRDAMALDDEGMLGRDQNLLNGCTVTVDAMPVSLKGIRFTPGDIEAQLRQKIGERLKNDHPLSNIHKIFKVEIVEGGEHSGHDERLVTRKGLRSVLCKFDILPCDQDFDVFFDKHHVRGDGLIEIRRFLTYLLPADNHHLNPFSPKEAADFTAQCNLAKVLCTVSGHRRRQISGLNGPAYTRFGGEEEDEIVSGVMLHDDLPGRLAATATTNPSVPLPAPQLPTHGKPISLHGYTDQMEMFGDTGLNFGSMAQHSHRSNHSEGSPTASQQTHQTKQQIQQQQQEQYSRHTQSSQMSDPEPDSQHRDAPLTADQFLNPSRPISAPPSFNQQASPRKNKDTRFVGDMDQLGSPGLSHSQVAKDPSHPPPSPPYVSQFDTIDSADTGDLVPESTSQRQRQGMQSPRLLAMLNKYHQLGQQHKKNPQPEFSIFHTDNDWEDIGEKHGKHETQSHHDDRSIHSAPSTSRSHNSRFSMPEYSTRSNSSSPNGKSKSGPSGSWTRPHSDSRYGDGPNTHAKTWKEMDPNQALLREKYKVAKKNTITNQEEYGLYIKNLAKAKKNHHMLRIKLLQKTQQM